MGRAPHNKTHGMSGTPTFSSWQSMKARCLNPKERSYQNYGGRGIKVCERWLESFDSFLEDMGLRPKGMTLDRFPDVNGDYEPGNCRWATDSQQARNRRSSRLITIDGVTKCASDWGDELGISPMTLRARIDHCGMTPEQAAAHQLGTRLRTGNSRPKKIYRGEESPKAKLCPSDVITIFSQKGSVTRVELAKRYGISEGAVSNIWLRRTWRHITEVKNVTDL